MPFSIEMDLDDGGHVTYDNVVSFTVEENPSDSESPDEVPEEGEPEREGNEEVDLSEEENHNPMDEEENN